MTQFIRNSTILQGKSSDLARRYEFTDDPVDNIRCREEVNEDLNSKFGLNVYPQ